MTHAVYGLMAEFDNPTALVNAARAARERGVTYVEPTPELSPEHKKVEVAFRGRVEDETRCVVQRGARDVEGPT